MTHASDMGDDEPTVIGHRPVAAGRNGRESERALPSAAAFDAAMPLRPAPSAVSHASAPPAPGLLAELPLSAEPSRPEDVIAAAATPLLALVAQLRQAVDYADVTALRTETVAQIKKFDERALKLGARVSDVSAARYVLCSLLDETVMTTPWGAASNWSTHSLLNQFHGETWGGEKVFAILDRVRANPAQHLALLKLVDLCLAFGFEGKYRVMEGGSYQLDEMRDELGRIWRNHVKALPEDLSPQWQGVSVRRQLRSALPLWVLLATAGVLLLGIYALFAFRLDQGVTPIESRFERIGAPRT